MKIAQAAVGKRRYGLGESNAPTRGQVNPSGYIKRELNNRKKPSQTRSGLAQAALKNIPNRMPGKPQRPNPIEGAGRLTQPIIKSAPQVFTPPATPSPTSQPPSEYMYQLGLGLRQKFKQGRGVINGAPDLPGSYKNSYGDWQLDMKPENYAAFAKWEANRKANGVGTNLLGDDSWYGKGTFGSQAKGFNKTHQTIQSSYDYDGRGPTQGQIRQPNMPSNGGFRPPVGMPPGPGSRPYGQPGRPGPNPQQTNGQPGQSQGQPGQAQGQQPPTVRINANGQLDLPFDEAFSLGLIDQQQQANTDLLDLQREQQGQQMQYQRSLRDAGTEYEGMKRNTLNQNAAGGTAFSSQYGVGASRNATNYNNYTNDLNSANTMAQDGFNQQRMGIQNSMSDYIRQAVLRQSMDLAGQAGQLGYGIDSPEPSYPDPTFSAPGGSNGNNGGGRPKNGGRPGSKHKRKPKKSTGFSAEKGKGGKYANAAKKAVAKKVAPKKLKKK